MRKVSFTILLLSTFISVHGQRVLTLDSCRALALRNNKQINISRLKQDVAMNTKKAMRTKYLPKVDVVAGYQLTSREVSLLSDDQKTKLSNIGTGSLQKIGSTLSTSLNGHVQDWVKQGVISPQQAQRLGMMMQQIGNGPIAQHLGAIGNSIGEQIVNGFRTDTRSMFGGAVMLRQPIYMGGAIIAANRMADISGKMAADDVSLKTQATLYDIDQAYWTVVSLRQKHKLANSYRDLVKKLDDDVAKMIKEGVATRADGLRVDVKVNEADMQITQVEDGLSLAKMLLCQLCGLPMDEDIKLADEDNEDLNANVIAATGFVPDSTLTSRPEIRLLQNAVELSTQKSKLIRAAYLPHVALTGGYLITNPNSFNGFQKKFDGMWNVGVLVQIPVWNWFEGNYKVKAAKSSTSIAAMELREAREKINLQIAQSRYKVSEAEKRLSMAEKNIKSAEENLRCAQIGFREGVMESTDVMAAQTAWQKAQSQKIDAEVEVKLSHVNLKKALGILN